MNRAGEILASFREPGAYVSGAEIAARMAVTRTAVWKYLRQLEQMGYVFETLRGTGYRLKTTPDRLYPWEIERHLHTTIIGKEIVYRDTVDSTNALAFQLALSGCQDGTCVIAESQSAGKGRLQRHWCSPHAKNLYVSIVLRPEVHPSRIYPLSFISSLAVFDALASLGVKPRLKWPNDVLVGSKKVCGTLIELSTEADRVRFVVIGIGLNINMDSGDMEPAVAGIATSLFLETKKRFERAPICGILLNGLEKYYDLAGQLGMEEVCRLWEERAEVKGTYMEVRQMDRVYRGISEGIDKDGALLLNENGNVTRVIAGDVTA
jgi:BirA family transcriptional regulator, biotin operon repressor / biotin---[acetyl-CoA-carboxylase] ligase